MADCANGYDPQTNPRGCRYHHQHTTRAYTQPTGQHLDGSDIELTRDVPWHTGDTCPGCLPHEQAEGRLCHPCYARLNTGLLDLPRLWQALAHHLAPGTGAGQARISGTPDTPNAITPAIYEHRRAIENALAQLVDEQARQNGHHQPWNVRYPPRAAGWLYTHLDTALQQPTIKTYLDTINHLTHKAGSLLDPSGKRRLRDIGPCSHNGCTGTVTALLAPADDEMPATLVCDTHPEHTVASTDWILAYERAEKRRKRAENSAA